MKIKVHDPEAFIKEYPKLTKTVPAVAAHQAPDKRKIANFLRMGGQVKGITVIESEDDEEQETAGPETPGKSLPVDQKSAEKQALQPGPVKPDAEAAAIAQSLRQANPLGPIDYTENRPQREGETIRDWHHRARLEYDAEQRAKQ